MAHSQAELVEVVVRGVNEQMRLLAQPSLAVDGNSSVAETDHDPDATLSKGAHQIDSPSFSFFSCISFILSSLLCFAFSVRAILQNDDRFARSVRRNHGRSSSGSTGRL